MSYEDMKELMQILDKYGILFDFGNYYDTEYTEDDPDIPKEYISGHWLKVYGGILDTDEIDDEDDRWNRG